MPGFLPASTYPFAINSFLGVVQIVLVIYGQNITNTIKLVPSFIMTGVIMMILPFLANIGGSTAYWSCFVILIFLGAFQGATQGTVFAMAAAFPFKYIGAVFSFSEDITYKKTKYRMEYIEHLLCRNPLFFL